MPRYLSSASEHLRYTCNLCTKYLARNSGNFSSVRTVVDPENSLPQYFAPTANLSVCASVITDGVATKSGVSSSVYPLTTMVMNYLAIVVTEGSITRWTEDGQSSLAGSVKNSTCDRISYSALPALHDLSSGSYQSVFSLTPHPLPSCPLWMHLIHLWA